MKRKLLFVSAAAVLIIVGLVVCLTLNRAPKIPGGLPRGLSQEDFRRIQQVTRHEMWRKAFPSVSWQTLKQSPRSFCLLATSSIREIELLGSKDDIQVRTRSHFGDYFFVLAKTRQEAGQWNYRVHMQGPQRLGEYITPYRGLESFGGGTLSFEAQHYETEPFSSNPTTGAAGASQRPVFTESGFSTSLSNHAKLTYNR